MVCKGVRIAKRLHNIILAVLGGIARRNHEGSADIKRGGGEISMHCSICDRSRCHSCASTKPESDKLWCPTKYKFSNDKFEDIMDD